MDMLPVASNVAEPLTTARRIDHLIQAWTARGLHRRHAAVRGRPSLLSISIRSAVTSRRRQARCDEPSMALSTLDGALCVCCVVVPMPESQPRLPASGASASRPPPLPTAQMRLTSFDGSTSVEASTCRPDRGRHWAALAARGPLTIRGGGYSYAPASLGSESLHIDMRAWRGVVDFDRTTGILEVEAGMSLGEVHRLASPAGWHLPSQPGYPEITVGGCIAGDVHGKNQHLAGNFRHCVRAIDLWHPDHGVLHLTKGDDLFELTSGGLGLTGVILSAVLQLERLVSHTVVVTTSPIEDAVSTPLALRAGSASLFSYTWQNFTCRSRVGRGVVYGAEYSQEALCVQKDQRYTTLNPQKRGWPVNVMGYPTIAALNAVYELSQRFGGDRRPVGLLDFLFPAARKATYFKMFGRRGFHEAQALIPHLHAADYLGALAELARARRAPVALASCKLFSGASKFVRFDGEGIVVAVNAPRDDRGADFVANVHRLMLEHHGRPNLLKDSLLAADTVAASVCGVDDFRAALLDFDPARRFRSVLADRLGL